MVSFIRVNILLLILSIDQRVVFQIVSSDNLELITVNLKFFKKFFLVGNSIKISVLQTNYHRNKIKDFTTNFFHRIRSINKTFVIEEINLRKNHLINDVTTMNYIIIVWSIQVLQKFLIENHSKVIPQNKGNYFIMILNNKKHQNFKDILKQLWDKHNVLNVVIQGPGTKMYSYYPFNHTTNTWKSTQTSEKLQNFNHFPLNISVFLMEPTLLYGVPKSLTTNPIYQNLTLSRGYGGMDGLLLRELVKYFNFDPIIVENFGEYGRVLPNGTAIGSLGDVVRRKVDLSINSRFLMDYKTQEIEFTFPYDSDELCMLVPKSVKVPVWKILLKCFSTLSWILILVSCIFCSFFWYFIGPSRIISKVLWQIYSYIVGNPYKIVPTVSQFIFLMTCFFFNIIIFGIIQGSFFTEFTTSVFYPDIDTLEDLYESNLPIATYYWFLIDGDSSDLMTKLKKHQIEARGDLYDQTAYHRNVSTLVRKKTTEMLIKKKYRTRDGTPLVHIVKECHTTLLLCNILPKGSHFLEVFNRVIMRLYEGGFIKKWFNDFGQGLVEEERFESEEAKDFVSLNLHDLQTAFYILLLGHSCSIFLFLCEIVIRIKNKIKSIKKYLFFCFKFFITQYFYFAQNPNWLNVVMFARMR